MYGRWVRLSWVSIPEAPFTDHPLALHEVEHYVPYIMVEVGVVTPFVSTGPLMPVVTVARNDVSAAITYSSDPEGICHSWGMRA